MGFPRPNSIGFLLLDAFSKIFPQSVIPRYKRGIGRMNSWCDKSVQKKIVTEASCENVLEEFLLKNKTWKSRERRYSSSCSLSDMFRDAFLINEKVNV